LGLDEKAVYSLGDKNFGGDYLMGKGYLIRNSSEYASKILVFRKVTS